MKRRPSTADPPSGEAGAGDSVANAEAPASAEQAVLTVTEAAALLRVDRKSLYEAIRRGEVPGAIRIGRIIRISHAVLLQWLQGDRVSRHGKNP